MRIALFSDSTLPLLNGVSVSVELLARALEERGHTVQCFGPKSQEDSPGLERYHRSPAIFPVLTQRYPIPMPWLGQAYGTLKRFRPDIIHAHTPWLMGIAASQSSIRLRCPIVATYHTRYEHYAHYVPHAPVRWTRKVIWEHTKRFYGWVSEVITPSEASAQWLRRHGISPKITIIPTGVEQLAIDPIDRERWLQKRRSGPLVVHVGRFAEEKNLPLLIESFREFHRRQPDAELWMAGGGELQEALELQSQNLPVRWLGVVPRQSLGALLSVGDFFVIPSITETQGLVVLEAQSIGLPPIVMKTGGTKTTVVHGESGLVVSPTVESLSEAMLLLATDSDLRTRLSQGAREKATHYSLDAMAAQVEEVYRRSIGSYRKRK